MKKVNDSYKMFQGNDIDRHLFVESIVDYLDNDIDEMNEKFNAKRIRYLANQKEKLPDIHKADANPQKVII